MISKLFLLLLPALGLWIYQTTAPIRKLEWLCGTWQNKTREGIIYESWEKTDNNLLIGKSFTLRGKDTLLFETITVLQNGDSLFYIPRVINQNDGLAVRFSLKSLSANAVVFENPDHDFPQFISYTRVKPDSLVAEIWGIKNGQTRKQRFPMKKLH